LLKPLEWERYITATAAKGNLKVQWEPDVNPRTDGKTIYLPTFTTNSTQEDYDMLRHMVAHEVEHNIYSDFSQIQKKNLGADNSFLGALWNFLEDVRIENLGSKEYVGDKEAHNSVHLPRVQKLLNALEKAPDEVKDRVLPAVDLCNKAYSDNYSSAVLAQSDINKSLTKTGQQRVVAINKGDYLDVLRNAAAITDPERGTAATYQLSRRLFKEIFGGDPDEEEKRCKEQAQQNGKGGKGKGGKESEEGQPNKPGEDKGDQEDTSQDFKIVYSKYAFDDHSSRTNKSMTGIHTQQKTPQKNTWNPRSRTTTSSTTPRSPHPEEQENIPTKSSLLCAA